MRLQIILAIVYCFKAAPLVFFLLAMPIVLRLEGYSLIDVGLLQLASFPYMLKFLWAPFFDKNANEKNHYKRWIFIGGALQIAVIYSIGFLDIKAQLPGIFALIFCAAIIATFIDNAVDGIYVKMFEFSGRAFSSSAKAAAGYVANVIAIGGIVYFYKDLGWSGSMNVLAALLCLALVVASFIDENAQERREQKKEFVLKNIYTFFKINGAKIWAFLIFIKSIAAWSILFMIKPMMVDFKLAPEDIALINGFFGVFVSILVSVVSMLSVAQKFMLQRRKALLLSAFLSMLGVLQILFLSADAGLWAFYYCVGFLNLATSFSAIISSTIFMDFSRKNCGATDYSLQMCIASVAPLSVSALSGFIVEKCGYAGFTQILCVIGILAFILIYGLFSDKWVEGK